MKSSFKRVFINFPCILTLFVRLAIGDPTIKLINNRIKLYYALVTVSLPMFGQYTNYKTDIETFDAIGYLDTLKLTLENGKLKVPRGALRFLITKEGPDVTEDELISVITDENILGGLSINADWISERIEPSYNPISFKGIRNYPIGKQIIWKDLKTGSTAETDEKEILADINLSLSGTQSKKSAKDMILDDFIMFTFSFNFLGYGIRSKPQEISIFKSTDGHILEILEERWKSLQTYAEVLDVELSTNSGGTDPKNVEKHFSEEERGGRSTAEGKGHWKKSALFVVAFLIVIGLLGLGLGVYIFLREKKRYVTRKVT